MTFRIYARVERCARADFSLSLSEDSLIYTDDIKNRLLNYIYTTLLFSDANVDFNVVTWNR